MDVARNVVVVGGGVAGVSTAAALRAGGYDGRLTLIDAGEFPYDRPPLSKAYLAGTRTLTDIALQPADWYDQHAVTLRTETTVRALDPGSGEVETADGSRVPADRVVLALGGRAARPPIPGADDPRVHTLRTAQDADRLRTALVPGARMLVVGAGLIGAEVASTAVDLGCDVVLVDPLAPPLQAAVGPVLAGWLHEQHARRGIATVCAGVESLAACGSAIDARLAGEDVRRRVDLVVLGVGMLPDVSIAASAGLAVDRGVVVDGGLVSSNPAVLAVGDLATVRVDGDIAARSEHWEAAAHDGARAAATILGAPAPEVGAPWFWTDRHHRHVEVVGSMAASADTVLRGEPGDEPFAAFGIRDGLLVGVVAVDEPDAVRAGRRLIDRRVPVEADRLADPATNLRRLLRG